jgi:transposase
MSKQCRTFSPEFKVSAASLVLDQGYNHRDACQSVGVAESVLRRWVQQLSQERQGRTPSNPAMTTDLRRIQELEARVARLEREKTILKKATALLMSKGIERTR